MKRLTPLHVLVYSFCSLLFLLALLAKENDAAQVEFPMEYSSFKTMAKLPLLQLPKREAWRKTVPEVEEIAIPRRQGEKAQPALWYHSGSDKKKPLLLVLHSWSDDYLQHYGIPYAVFARQNDWIFLHPNFRGPFDNADATASEKAVQDVLDALEYAKEQAPVDEERVYLAGFSGGAMMSLVMAGRYPDLFSAVLAWVPVFDLNDWHATVIKSGYRYTAQYRSEIEASCGGNPQKDEQAKEQCRKRSPSSYLAGARGKKVRFFLSGGIKDHFVSPSHAIRAFNVLAEEGDIISDNDLRHIEEQESLPEGLRGQGEPNAFFDDLGLPLLLARRSANATLFLFDGGHDIVYNAGLQWLSEQGR